MHFSFVFFSEFFDYSHKKLNGLAVNLKKTAISNRLSISQIYHIPRQRVKQTIFYNQRLIEPLLFQLDSISVDYMDSCLFLTLKK